jgi:hypothetical protein
MQTSLHEREESLHSYKKSVKGRKKRIKQGGREKLHAREREKKCQN